MKIKLTFRTALCIGFIFHVVFVLSIFDMYFTSPVLRGLMSPEAPRGSPAKRVVLLVADGLRADTFFEYLNRPHQPMFEDDEPSSDVPFLRHVVREKGAWGISHTRVPTESRPGHVALIAGFYEDVSAVTHGWTKNPVPFDHVFKQSSRTWSFGSPDILPMFAENLGHVHAKMYEPEAEDFGSGRAWTLDKWVFDEVSKLFEQAESNVTLKERLHQDHVVFFLHLLGIDTNGHAYRPHSKEYKRNVAYVCRGVEAMTSLIESFYENDGRTSYVFTSDHGMSDKGSHGDGDPQNTRCPVVAWGAGVDGPRSVVEDDDGMNAAEKELNARWGLNDVRRRDMLQADIAPLMSSLIGSRYPANSVGKLPREYLRPGRYRAASVVANVRQLFEQLYEKSENRRRRSVLFRPFGPTEKLREQLERAQSEFERGNFDVVETISDTVVDGCLKGFRYFDTYDRQFLGTVVVLGYVGWMSFVFVLLRRHFDNETSGSLHIDVSSSITHVALRCVLIAHVALHVFLLTERSPPLYHAYVAFTFLFLELVTCEIIRASRNIRIGEMVTSVFRSADVASRSIYVVSYVALLIAIAEGFHHRTLYAVCCAFVAFWPLCVNRLVDTSLPVLWFVSCMALAIFPLLPVHFVDNVFLVCAGSVTVPVFATIVMFVGQRKQRTHTGDADSHSIRPSFLVVFRRKDVVLQIVQTFLIVVAVVTVHSTHHHLVEKNGLPLLNRAAAWTVMLISPVVATLSSPEFETRFLSVFQGLAAPYALLSVSYESIFLCVLGIVLFFWFRTEHALHDGKRDATLSLRSHVRMSLFYVLLIHVAFFGTGNVASLSSFELSSTYRFVTVFSPFLMATLLVVKIFIPFLLVCTALGIIGLSLGMSRLPFYLICIAMCDVLSVRFFFAVRDEGSWKEIGNSISHFVMANVQIILIPILITASSGFVRGISNGPREAKIE